MTRLRTKVFAAAAFATIAIASSVSALTLQSTLGENGLGNTGSIRGEWGGAAMMKNLGEAEGSIGAAEEFTAWCVEPFVTLQTRSRYREADFLSGTILGYLDKLFTLHYADVIPGVETTAFSIAVWDIVYDGSRRERDIGLQSGFFNTRNVGRGAASSVSKADDYLKSVLAADDSVGGGYELIQLQSRNSQNLIVARPLPSAVPIPAAGLLLGTALFTLHRMRKKA